MSVSQQDYNRVVNQLKACGEYLKIRNLGWQADQLQNEVETTLEIVGETT